MRITRATLFILLGGGLLLGSVGMVQAQATRSMNRTMDLSSDGHLQIRSFGGSINVSTWDRAEVEVQTRIEGDDPERVEEVQVQFEGNERHRTIEVDYDDVGGGWSLFGLFDFGEDAMPPVHFTIQMPRTARLSVGSFSSDIKVQGLRGNLSVQGFSSPIELQDMEGLVDVETFSGSLRVEDLRGGLQMETFSGDASVRVSALTEDLQFSGFSADLDLYVPLDASFEIVAKGDDINSIPSEFSPRTEESGRIVVGNGGPRIQIETFSGSCRLHPL